MRRFGPTPSRLAGALGLGLGLGLILATAAVAAPRVALPAGLQQAAILCLGEAVRLCPTALTAKDHGIACMLGKRRLLSQTCRVIYDQGVSFLNGGDVHLDLRALKAHPPKHVVPDAKGLGAPASPSGG